MLRLSVALSAGTTISRRKQYVVFFLLGSVISLKAYAHVIVLDASLLIYAYSTSCLEHAAPLNG